MGKVQPRPITINGLLFKADCKDSSLVVPKGVKKFHSCLFDNKNIPFELVCDFIPLQKDMKNLWCSGSGCRTLKITSSAAKINLSALKKFDSLAELILPEDYKQYKTVDGILYSHDGKTLVFYPRGKLELFLLFQTE